MAARIFSEEAVLIDPEANVVRMLNPVATRIWELADGSRTVDQIAEALSEEYEIDKLQARQSTSQFVEALCNQQLLVLS